MKPSKVLIELIKGMLETNVSKRFTAQDCIKSLDIWISELRSQIKSEYVKKKKPLPKNLEPLADKTLIKQAF